VRRGGATDEQGREQEHPDHPGQIVG
jgi:hypothetical protein